MNARTETFLVVGILVAGFVALASAGPAHIADVFGGDDVGGARKRRSVRRRVRLMRTPARIAAAVAAVEAATPSSAAGASSETDDEGDEAP